jgi:alkanesulfonate monooxygenase SsuD/methylene tetrahydromethanopterin reductase-like flavin-dependent oxidoreductase (luciferase family)
VTCNSYRHPSILAKITTTADIISEGRLEFGIGAGWFEKEYYAYGIPFPDTKIRLEQLDEAIDVIKRIWTREKTTFEGKYYSLHDLIAYPKPLQTPYPPIMIGGKSTILLNIAAKYADNLNLIHCNPKEYRQRLEIFKDKCRMIGRDYDRIIKSWHGHIIIADREKAKKMVQRFIQESSIKSIRETPLEALMDKMIIGFPDDCIETIQKYVEAGAEYFIPHFLFSKDLTVHQVFIDEVASAF